MIYFILCGDLVKIGTSSDVRARLSQLQVGNPMPIVLLGEITGGKAVESNLHRRFSSLRDRGEWFRYSGELHAFIDGVIAATPRECFTVPYGLFDDDSAFFGLFDESGLICRAYVQARRASKRSNVGQWWLFEGATNPTGWSDPIEQHKRFHEEERGLKTVSCALRDACGFGFDERCPALQQLLQKAREFQPLPLNGPVS